MSYVIYQHRNKVNDKTYVGCVLSHKGMMSRWKRHLRDARKGSSSIFHRAIIFHGDSDDVWEHVELQHVETHEEACDAERLWIARLRCNGLREDHYGYNMTDGGDGVMGYKHSEERRRRISRANLGKKRSDETRQRMRKPKSIEHREKLRKHLQKISGLPHKAPVLDEDALAHKRERLREIAQLPHVKEAKRQAQLRRWAKWRFDKEQL